MLEPFGIYPMERKWRSRPRATAALAALLALAGCSLQEAPHRDSTAAAPPFAARGAAGVERWQPPVVDSTPDDPYEAAVYRGLMLVSHTHDRLPRSAGASLSCASCHLDDGRRRGALPLVGATAGYPAYAPRDDMVETIEDRVNSCLVRSLTGVPLPADGRDMHDIVAYLAFISTGVPQGETLVRQASLSMSPAAGDSARGRDVYVHNCARCHGGGGAGMGAFPPLWGPKAFSIGASMARRGTAAAFIRRNMPFDTPGVLTDQQAMDVAAYMTSMPRPDTPGKERDWPNGDAPPDAPYATKGHPAFHAPRLLARERLGQR